MKLMLSMHLEFFKLDEKKKEEFVEEIPSKSKVHRKNNKITDRLRIRLIKRSSSH